MSEPDDRCEVSAHRVGVDSVVVQVSGDLDMNCHWAFSGTAAELAPAHLVVVDLTRCLFCDSQGLLELIALEHAAQRMGAEFRLAGASPVVRRALEMCGADKYLVMFPSVDAALNAGADARAGREETPAATPQDRASLVALMPIAGRTPRAASRHPGPARHLVSRCGAL